MGACGKFGDEEGRENGQTTVDDYAPAIRLECRCQECRKGSEKARPEDNFTSLFFFNRKSDKKEAGDRCKDSSYTKMRNSLLDDGMTEIFIPQ
jgi:hypothetical protein